MNPRKINEEIVEQLYNKINVEKDKIQMHQFTFGDISACL